MQGLLVDVPQGAITLSRVVGARAAATTFVTSAWDPTTNVAAHGRAALSAGGRWVETHRGARTVAAPFVQTAGRGIRARTAMATTIAWLAFPSLRLSWLKTNGWVLARCSDPVQTPVSYSYKL